MVFTNRRFLCLTGFVLGLPLLVAAQTPEYAPGEIIVKLKRAPKASGQARLGKLGVPSLDALNAVYGATAVTRLWPERRIAPRASATDRETWDRLYRIALPAHLDPAAVAADYARDAHVEYAQPNYVHRVDTQPNDPLFPSQVALRLIQADLAWELQLAVPDVIVGIIDTGIDYEHDDLRDAIWLNPGEDLNGNGRVDPGDFNGLDDDGNGFVDDLRGWDFTDAPAFPDGGDFQEPDNDPFDDNGHGTAVAGLIGASGDNGIGIAGLAYGCRLMNLRAGTSQGFLEEDDVAAALVYAVENGARIVNMSFGDDVASPLLQDVIQFAYRRNCVLVASAGNSSTDRIHFPSGFRETISVGATGFRDELASFSNFGSSVDLVAPGVNVVTTLRNGRYGGFSGTSASAPLVSGLAALLLSKTPQLSNEAVRGLLTSTADDLGEEGWDAVFAAGRVNAFRALQSPRFSVVRLDAPEVNQGFAGGTVAVRGTAVGAVLDSYVLEIGVGESPREWRELVRRERRPVVDEVIWELDLEPLPDGLYTLRLTAHNRDGTSVEDKVPFLVDRTPPRISNVRQTPMLDADRPSVLLEFETDDVCNATLFYRPLGSAEPHTPLPLRFRTRTHRLHLQQERVAGEIEFYLEAVNAAGLRAVADHDGRGFTADLSGPAVGGLPVARLPYDLPSGFLLAKPSDFNRDGRSEIVLSRFDLGFRFGPVTVFEFQDTGFKETYRTVGTFVPRDWGDADGDGLLELLLGRGAESFLYEAETPNGWPDRLVWNDDRRWASRFADLDQDGRGELVLREDDLFQLWENNGDNRYVLVDSFPNPTEGNNFTGVPRSEVGDFDGDGRLEILLGDFDGDVYLYENRGDNRSAFTWSERLPLLDTIDYLTQGDFDGDGVAEFAVGSHSDPGLNSESELDSRHWLYRIYRRTGDDAFAAVWEQAFFGFQSPLLFDSGVASGDLDGDGRDELIIHVFPDVYVVDYEPSPDAYRVVWYAQPGRSNGTVVGDFDRDGQPEFYYHDGTQVAGWQVLSDFTGPPTPLAVRGRPLDSTRVELTWQAPAPGLTYRIYRGPDAESLVAVAESDSTRYLDRSVAPNVAVWYAVTAVDATRTPAESLPTAPVRVLPGPRPFVEEAAALAPNRVRLAFSEPMAASAADHTNYVVEGVGTPTSAVTHRLRREVLLTLPRSLQPGTYRVVVQNVTDADGTPLDPARNAATFTAAQPARTPYLLAATLVGPNRIRLEFSEAMDPVSAGEASQYEIEPKGRVVRAWPDAEAPQFVDLEIESPGPIAPAGVDYVITVRDVASRLGVRVKAGEGNSIALILSNPDLRDVFAYPNPYRPGLGQDYVTIGGLTPRATVRILTANGRLVRTLEETDGNGGVRWDLKDEAGREVSAGVYLFYVVSAGQRTVGKLAVLR